MRCDLDTEPDVRQAMLMISNMETGDTLAVCPEHALVHARTIVETAGGGVYYPDAELHAAYGSLVEVDDQVAPSSSKAPRKRTAPKTTPVPDPVTGDDTDDDQAADGSADYAPAVAQAE